MFTMLFLAVALFYMEALFLENLYLLQKADLNIGVSSAINSFAPCIIAIFEFAAYRKLLKGSDIFGIICLVFSTTLISLAKEGEEHIGGTEEDTS